MKNFILLSALLLGSCSSFFEQTPDDMLPGDENFTDRSNIYASFMGLMGTLQDATDDLIVLGELRGDLLAPTDRAPEDYWEVFRNLPMADNPVADPAPLYCIVMNCNDFLRNTAAYNRNYPGVLPVNTYRQLIAGAVSLRTWAYLQIGKLYGSAVYYDYAFTGEVDLSKLPALSLDDLIPELIRFMNTGVDNISGNRRVDIDAMFGVDGTIWRRLAIAPDALMCELYLWDRNYEAAAKRGINMIAGQGLLDAGNDNNLTCSNQFGGSGGLKPWYALWSETPVNVHTNEGLTMALFNYAQRQTNRLHELFSTTPPNLYYLKPTANLLAKFTGQDYRTGSTVVVDPRGEGVTYGAELGETVAFKYHNSGRLSYLQEAPIYIYRAAEVHLMIAEALTALGNYDAADKILNEGFKASWVNGNSFGSPFDAPIYAYQKLKGGVGIRGRVEVPQTLSTATRFMRGYAVGSDGYNARRRFVLDSLIVEETARELAFEGKRWFTLMRIGRNGSGAEFVADMVSRKFPEGGERDSYRNAMLDSAGWFISYDLKLENR
jgi:hypothetical protein